MTEDERQVQLDGRRFPYYGGVGKDDPNHSGFHSGTSIKGREGIDLFKTSQAKESEN